MDEFEQTTSGISRRKALQRIGVAGAAVWAAPVVTGILPSAAAASPLCTAAFRDEFVVCGSTSGGCSAEFCICDVDTEGNHRCWADNCCSALPACSTSVDCPPSTHCFAATGCFTPVCIQDCGAGVQVSSAGDGTKASDR